MANKSAHQLRLERLSELKQLRDSELKLNKPSHTYIQDLHDSINELEKELALPRVSGYKMI